jgi:oligoendopeptidase F
MAKTKAVPARSDVKQDDTWDLTKLFKSDDAWQRGYKKLERMIPRFETFRGKLGRSAKTISTCFDFEVEFETLGERLGVYAFLRSTADVANSHCQGMVAQFTYLATQAGEVASFIAPELQAIPKKKMAAFMKKPILEPYRLELEKLLRYRPHILSEKEERVLAMQGEVAGSSSQIFSQLNDADLKFGFVKNEKGEEVELTQSSFRSLLESPRRSVRKAAFTKFYEQYAGHANTLSSTLSSSVLQDVYGARVRNHNSALDAALFSDKVPLSVYDSLIEAVHDNLETMYRYLGIRKRALRLKDLHAYDTAVPIVKTEKVKIPYEEAVDNICAALAPMGAAYVNHMRKGLLGSRWVDRYENKGKRSGAFSSGAYGSPPYILMNYKEDVIDGMFTLAHEAGHSMHSYLSGREQPFHYSHYTIFVAEVASTFNEQLLGHYLMERATTKKDRARLINKEIEEIRGTIIRQTMFAEYEKIIHAIAEEGQPLTLDVLRGEYRNLIELYFGPDFVVDEGLDLEGLRIPHFYSAFYVYKYATGLSAAIALSRSVLGGGKKELDRYTDFLKSGSSKFPLDLLRTAGVDLKKPDAVNNAMTRFRELVDELDELTTVPTLIE